MNGFLDDRICVSLGSGTRRNLLGTFEVAHIDERLPEGNLQYLKGMIKFLSAVFKLAIELMQN